MALLSVVWVVVGLWAIATSDAYESHVPLHHTRIDIHDIVRHANGGSSTVKVLGSVRKNVIVVGQHLNEGGVLNVSCNNASVIEILTTTPHWWKDNVAPGSVIIGSPELGCKNAQGAAIPFYRLVAEDGSGGNFISEKDSTISITSTEIGLLGCFGPSTSVRASYTPAFAQESSVKGMPSTLTNASHSRARRIGLGYTFDIDETRSQTYAFNTKDGTSAIEKEKLMWSKSYSKDNCQDSCEEEKASGLLSQGSLGGCKASCTNITAKTTVVCKNCYSKFDAGFVVEFDLRAWLGGWSFASGVYGPGYRLEYALFKVFADANASATVVATVQAKMTNKGRIDFFGRKDLIGITFFLGPIPIFVQSSYKLEGEYSVVAKISGMASAGLAFTRRLEMGYQYRNGVWQTINTQMGSGVALLGPSLSAKASTQVQLQLIPQFSVDFQALARISVGLKPTLLIDASYECVYASGRWQGQQGCDGIKWGVRYNIGAFVELDVTDGVAGLAKYGFDPRASLGLPRAFSTTIVKTTPIKNGCLVPEVLICSGRNPPPTPPPTPRPTLLPVPSSPITSQPTPVPTSTPNSPPTPLTHTSTAVPTLISTPTSAPTPPRINACDNPIGAGYTTGCSSAANCTTSVDVSTRTCVCMAGFVGNGESCLPVEMCTATECGRCLADARCVWCSSQTECIQAKTSSVCEVAWESSCVAPEVPITNARIKGYTEGDTITAGTDVLIEWDGGDDNGVIAFTWRDCEDCPLDTGLGLPSHLLSSRQFSWTISYEIFNLTAFQIGVTSATDPAISSITPAYVVVGGAPNIFEWVVGAWGHCDQLCDTGTQPRSVTCANLAGVVDVSKCPTLSKPSPVRPCNTQSCSALRLCEGFAPASLQNRFPDDNMPSYGSCRCLKQNNADIINGKAEEFCGFDIPGRFRVGCNQDFCCNPLSNTASPDNTKDCYDPCRTDSRWVVVRHGTCSKECGGGTHSLRYNCLTPALKGENGADLNALDGNYYYTCNSEQCEVNDGKIVSGKIVKAYESDLPQTQACNEQRCVSYAFVLSIPEVCPVPCGGGVAPRDVTCQSSVFTEVDLVLCTGGVGDVPSTTVACNTHACEEVPLFLQLPAADQSGISNSTQSSLALPGSNPTYKAGTTLAVEWAGGKYNGHVNISWAIPNDDLVDDLQNEQMVPVAGCECSTAVVGIRTWQPYCQTDPDDSQPRCVTEASSSLCPRRLALPESNGKYFTYCSTVRDQALARMQWQSIATMVDNVGVFNWTIPNSMAPVVYEMKIVSANDATNMFYASFSLCVTSVVDGLQCLPCASVCSANNGASCANATARGCDKCRFFTVVRNSTQGADNGLCVTKCPADTVSVENKCFDRPVTLAPTVVPTVAPTTAPGTPQPTQSPVNNPTSQPTPSPTTTTTSTTKVIPATTPPPPPTTTPPPPQATTTPPPPKTKTQQSTQSPIKAPSVVPSSAPSTSPDQAPVSSSPTYSSHTLRQSTTQPQTPSTPLSTPQSTRLSILQSTQSTTTISVALNPTQSPSDGLSSHSAVPSTTSNHPPESTPAVTLQTKSSQTTATTPPTPTPTLPPTTTPTPKPTPKPTPTNAVSASASSSPTMSPTQQGWSSDHDNSAALQSQRTRLGVGIGLGVLVLMVVVVIVTMYATGRWGHRHRSHITRHSSNPYTFSGASHKHHSTVQLNPMFAGQDTHA